MDPRFIATPPASEIAAALALWPEVAGKRVRPLFVTAFGDIYAELMSGEVVLATPLKLTCDGIARSARALGEMFVDPDWADEQVLAGLVIAAEERGLTRFSHQVFGADPHPALSGGLRVEDVVVMDLVSWHRLAAQLRRR